MPSLANSPLRLFQRFSASKIADKPTDSIHNIVLDGATAVAITETYLADVATLNTSFPAQAANIVWKAEQERKGVNCFGAPLGSRGTEGPRGALAAAMGLAMSGVRATVFLSSADLIRGQDLLVMAAGRHLPLVVHLTNQTLAAQAGALGTGHETYHTTGDSGCFMLLATNVQEAVDLTLIARRTAELSLIPGIVAMDTEQTALAVQNVSLPSPDLIRSFLGPAHEKIRSPTPAQGLIFGETRRRIPGWHDLDRPVLHGALQGTESWGLSAVAKRPYFDRHVAAILWESSERLAEHTHRPLKPLSTHRMRDAHIALVTQGSATETARAAADYMRRRGMKVGVVGIRCLRPFPGPQLAEVLRGKRIAGVLERSDTPLAADPPLTRQLRAAIDRALENQRFGRHTHPHYPVIAETEQPRLRSVLFGLGGLPLRGADLVALCEELARNMQKARPPRRWFESTSIRERSDDGAVEQVRSRIYLGFDFARVSSVYPKRQVLLDMLRRDYPEIANLGLRGNSRPDLRPKGALTVAIHRIPGQGAEGLAIETAEFLQRLLDVQVRSHPGLYWERFESYCVDRVDVGPAPLRDPGDEVPVDISVITTPRHHQFMRPIANLIQNGVLMTESLLDGETFWRALPPVLREGIRIKQARLYRIAPPGKGAGLELSKERLLGALVGALGDAGRLSLGTERFMAVRDAILRGLPITEREARLAAFTGGIDGVHRVDYDAFPSPDGSEEAEEQAARPDEIPTAVRQLGKANETYDSLPRFWHQVGVMYQNGETHELTPDPYLATGVVPPLTATFRDFSNSRGTLPAFNPAVCTGCGNCWAACPDSAMAPLVIGARKLMDTGIRMAGAGALRPIAPRLANALHGRCADAARGTTPATVADLMAGAPIPEGGDAKADMEKLLGEIGSVAVAGTAPFFTTPEVVKAGSGALFSLFINPNTCKACGICVRTCEAGALTTAPQTQGRVGQARRLWRVWERLPETDPETRARARRDPRVNPMAALLLSRQCLFSMAGGDGAEAGSGEKIAVRLMLTAVEAHQEPLVEGFLADIHKARGDLLASIQGTVTDALPTHDLDALATGLASVHPGQVPLTELTKHLDTAEDAGVVDIPRLRRLVALTRALGDLHWEITNGRQGMGRARFGLAVGPGSLATWAGAYPNNPFHVPVTVDMTGDTAQLAAGIFEGQLRRTTESIQLLREALDAIDQGGGQSARTRARARAPFRTDSTRPLVWRDLTPEEQRLCPPVILLGNNESLGGRGLAAILWLLSSDLPCKILIVSELDLGLDTVVTATDAEGVMVDAPFSLAKTPRINIGLLALAQYRAYVAQTSIADPKHFLASINAAMDYTGPALLHVHAPSPERHGFPMSHTLDRARDAVRSRVFPLFRYDPRAQGVFGLRIDLTGNPDPSQAWTTENRAPYTPAHWALGEGRFAEHFVPVAEEEAPEMLPLAEYLERDPGQRAGKMAVVHHPGLGGERTPYQVDPDLVTAIRDRRDAWRILQEMAGLVTPFTGRIEAQAEQRMAMLREAERDVLQKGFDDRVAGLRESVETEVANRVHARLMRLAGLEV